MARFRIKKPYNKQHIANAIINEVIAAKRETDRPVNPNNIRDAITPIIDETNFTIVVHLDSTQAHKVINVTVPVDGTGMTLDQLRQFVDRKWPSLDDIEEFGRICLYGCGR